MSYFSSAADRKMAKMRSGMKRAAQGAAIGRLKDASSTRKAKAVAKGAAKGAAMGALSGKATTKKEYKNMKRRKK